MAQKYFREMGGFWSMCLKASIKVVSECHDLGTCIFSHRGGFDRLEVVVNLDAYQITNYQLPSKTHHFLLPDF